MTDKPTLQERYRSAVRSSNLKSEAKTTRADADVLGAYGFAARQLEEGYVRTGLTTGHPIPPSPLSVPLERFLAGDSKAGHGIVTTLAEMAWSKAERENIKPKLTRPAAHDAACVVLAWFRNGTCVTCSGHGYELIPGAPALSDRECDACSGSGKRPLEAAFPRPQQDLVRWMVAQMESALGRAGPQAMAAIAPRLDL